MPKTKKTTKNSTQKRKSKTKHTSQEKHLPLSEFGQIFAHWEFPEFIKHPKSNIWYISFTIIILALLIYSYFSDNLLFAIILVLFSILYFSLEKKGPAKIQAAITEDGLVLNNKLLEYSTFENFYIIYIPLKIKNLYLEPKDIFKHRITISLEEQDPNLIRNVLLQYLEEDLEKEEIPTSESISKIFRL